MLTRLIIRLLAYTVWSLEKKSNNHFTYVLVIIILTQIIETVRSVFPFIHSFYPSDPNDSGLCGRRSFICQRFAIYAVIYSTSHYSFHFFSTKAHTFCKHYQIQTTAWYKAIIFIIIIVIIIWTINKFIYITFFTSDSRPSTFVYVFNLQCFFLSPFFSWKFDLQYNQQCSHVNTHWLSAVVK